MAYIDENEIETEIVPFLLPKSRPDLRAIAVRYFLGLTGTEEGRLFLSKKPKYIELIADLIDDDNVDTAKNVSMTFVNLAADLDILNRMPNNTKLISHVLKSAVGQSKIDSNVSAMALSNLSRSEQSAKNIADLLLKENDLNVSIHTLIEALNRHDGRELEHLASFLSNLTQVREVRRLILCKDRDLLQHLLPYISFKESVVKRAGVTATIRNCCFETDCHEWLLSEEVDILPRLLLPLAGPEEFDEDDMEKLPVDLQYLEPDKTREPDASIRCMLVEAINQLCALKSCRDFIKKKNAYVILRELHTWETDESNIIAIENVISLLISDEPEPGMENLNEVIIPEDVIRKLVKLDEEQKSSPTS